MLPARDRITALTVFPSKQDALDNTNGTVYTTGIVDSSGRLERTFFRSLPGFGECNAAMFECELAINVDLTGKWIRVATQAYATEQATSRTNYWLFTGLVDSCKYDSQQATRKLVAYDEMYRLRNLDISTWWNTYWAGKSANVYAGTVLEDMMAAYGVVGQAATTYSSYFSMVFDAQQKKLFSGCSFAQVLSYLSLIRPGWFFFNTTGRLTFVKCADKNKTNTPVALDTNVDTGNSLFEDADTSEFNSVIIYSGNTVVYSDGSNPPTFAQQDNPLMSGFTSANYANVGQYMLALAKSMSGLRRAEIGLIVSSPDVVIDRTQAVSYNGVTYMVSGISMFGPQLIDETILCTNEMSESPYYSAAVTSDNLVDGVVTEAKLGDGAVGTAKLAESAVTEGKIAASAVTGTKIASLAVDNAKLAANAVTEGKLAANAVTEGKIAANAVVADKIASNAVTTDKLNALAVTAAKLAAGSVTANKIDTNAVTADKINAGAVTSVKIDANAVVAEKIASGAVSTDKLAALAVTAAKIDSGAITADKIAAYAVTVGKIDPSVDMATNAGVASTYATKTNSVKREQRIYRKNNSTTAPSAPTSWITSTSVTSSAWTTKRMSYDSSYPYLWTCLQTETNDGTITCSTVLLDDTLTVIDGGSIITSSIAANKVDVTDLSAFNATIGGWSIDSSQILKEITADGYVYQVCLNAPSSPTTGNWAVGVRRRATDSQSWSYLSYFNYGGKLYSQNAEITGKVTTSEGNIGGWTISSNMLSKSVTIDGYEYQILLNAPETPIVGNMAVGIRKRAVGSDTWSYPCYINYGGTLVATNASITGGSVAGSTVGTGVDAGNLTTGTLDAARIAAGSITANKIDPSADFATNSGVAGTYATKAAAASEEQFIYISKASGTTSVSGTTTWVTSSADTQNAWRIRRPTYSSSYPVVFVAKQTKTVSGTVTCTTPIIDNTTTVIDGGNITTYSITANKISITDLQALNATIAGWSITSTQIKKSFTIDDVVYTAYMQAITNNPAATNGAFVISQTSNGTTTYPFIVRYNGNLIARNATIVGDVTATSGKIGNWEIDDDSLTCTINGDTLAEIIVPTSNSSGYISFTDPDMNDSATFSSNGVVSFHRDGEYPQYYSRMELRNDDSAQYLEFQTVDEDGTIVSSFTKTGMTINGGPIGAPTTTLTASGQFFIAENRVYTGDTVTEYYKTTQSAGSFAVYENNVARLKATALGLTVWDSSGNEKSKITNTDLVVNNTDVLAELPKVTQTATTTSADYPLLFGESSFTQNTQVTTKTEGARISGGIFVNPNTATINARRIHSGTTSQYGRIVLGNAIANGTAGCSHGEMYIYGKGNKYVRIGDVDGVIDANQTYKFPNQSGYLVVDAVTSGSGTRTTAGAASGSTAAWSRTGKVVSVNISSLKAASTSNPTELFSGLPKATQDTYFICQASATATYRHALLKITTDGKIVNAGDALSNTVAVYGNVMYITSE